MGGIDHWAFLHGCKIIDSSVSQLQITAFLLVGSHYVIDDSDRLHRGKGIHMATIKIHFACKVAHSTHCALHWYSQCYTIQAHCLTIYCVKQFIYVHDELHHLSETIHVCCSSNHTMLWKPYQNSLHTQHFPKIVCDINNCHVRYTANQCQC